MARKLTWLMLAIIPLVVSCASQPKIGKSYTEWDFEHNLQFTVTPLKNNQYLLTIASNKFKHKHGRKPQASNFARASALLLRRSLQLCKNYNYQLTIVDGVEGFYDAQDRPNLLISALSAELRCK